MLSSLYYGLFLAVYFVVLGGALWLGRGRPRRPVWTLAAGAALAGALVAPVASRYIANKPMMGDRDIGAIRFYSAEGSDYLKSHDRSRTYLGWSRGGSPERQLFPRLTPVVLSAVALWPPLSVARMGYAAALAVTVDGSLGLNGGIYPWLHAYVSPFRGLRVPARFAILVGLTLSILAGYGAARLVRRWPRQSAILTALMLTAVVVEALPRMQLEPVWLEPPPIYDHIPGEPKAVVAEFPMPADGLESWLDTRYLYFSTWHWHRLVNGNSGFFPPSYEELLARARGFPSEESVAYLKERGVEYVTVHGAFMRSQARYRNTVAMIEDRSDLELVTAVPWEGSESRLYRLRRDAGGPEAARRQRPR
jgi:hypothetical protein